MKFQVQCSLHLELLNPDCTAIHYLNFVTCTDIRIVNGILAELNEFPWMAALVYEESNGEQKTACGGSLISSNVIITAAHCIPSTNDQLSNYELRKIKIGAR